MRAGACGPSPQPLSRRRERGFGDSRGAFSAARLFEVVIPAQAGIQGFTEEER